MAFVEVGRNFNFYKRWRYVQYEAYKIIYEEIKHSVTVEKNSNEFALNMYRQSDKLRKKKLLLKSKKVKYLKKKMSKRKRDDFEEDIQRGKQFLEEIGDSKHQHTLDSDEDDQEDESNPVHHMNTNDIEGEEEGDTFVNAEEEIKFTPFNMKEELEEGHFDKEGHFHFNKGEAHLDNWLDEVDWVKVKKDEDYRKKYYTAEGEYSSDDDDDEKADKNTKFDHLASYKEIISFMHEKESINATLQRLNKSKLKVSTAQRWKLKKQGITDESSASITKLTGIANEILSQTGNMNVYELTYEQINFKIKEIEDRRDVGTSKEAELDIFSDDFDEQEKNKIKDKTVTFKEPQQLKQDEIESEQLMWEYRLTQDENDNILGPFSTLQMQQKVDDGDFKETVYVRKVGETQFYSSARIDFDLYL